FLSSLAPAGGAERSRNVPPGAKPTRIGRELDEDRGPLGRQRPLVRFAGTGLVARGDLERLEILEGPANGGGRELGSPGDVRGRQLLAVLDRGSGEGRNHPVANQREAIHGHAEREPYLVGRDGRTVVGDGKSRG